MDDFVYRFAMVCVSAYVFALWFGDYGYFKRNGRIRKGAFAGATEAPLKLTLFGAACGIILALLLSALELKMGLSDKQTSVPFYSLLPWIAAAFIEELVFRGYLYVRRGGKFALWSGIIAMSVVFAACHPYVWDYGSGGLSFDFSAQPVVATFGVFACSVVFYTLRFCEKNKYRSLIPCVAAHFSYNVCVYAVKAAQGFVEWNF